MDERKEILEAIQDGLDTGEDFLAEVPHRNKDMFSDPEFTSNIEKLAENIYGKNNAEELEKTSHDAAAPVGCSSGEKAAAGGCATCGFKCGMAKLNNTSSDIPGNDPFAEKNPTKMDEPPFPETTFPMPQILLAVSACVAGCYFAERIINGLFH